MKYLTMVARNGAPKAPANSMVYTLIGDDFSVQTMSGDKLAAALNDRKIVVTNMAVSSKGLVSTNGSIDKYTLIDPAGNLVGSPRAVILNRMETNGKLSGYIVFGLNGTIGQVTIAQAAQLAQNGVLANGKVRHTSEGDIVSAIGGNYPLLETVISNPKTSESTVVDLVLFGCAINGNKSVQYAGVTLTSKDARTIAKLLPTMEKANEALTEKLTGEFNFTSDELNSIKIKQAPGAGFYGVYPMSAVNKLLENGKKKCSLGMILVSCRDCDGDNDESIAVYDPKKQAAAQKQTGTAKSDEKLIKFIEEVGAKLSK